VEVERAVLPGYGAMMVDAHKSVAPHEVIDGSVRWLMSHFAARAAQVPPTGGGRSVAADGFVAEGASDVGIRERAVIFEADRGLFGVLSDRRGDHGRCRTGIVVANAGSVHTVGPGRLYVELARDWAARGFSVLRMDVGGVGDSETRPGSADNHPYPDHAVQDIASAVRWMVEHTGVSRVIVAGLCSGAHASFHAGLELQGIEGIIVINPIVFYWSPACALDVSVASDYFASRHYPQAVRQIDSWVRLARGDIRVGKVASVGYRRILEVAAGAAATFGRRLGWRGPDAEDVAADLGRISARGVDVLLVFSEGDPGLDFVQRRYGRDVRLLERERSNFALRIVPNADHTFSRLETRERLARLLTDHLETRHRGRGNSR
jgi:Serine aminopeptidase, S33